MRTWAKATLAVAAAGGIGALARSQTERRFVAEPRHVVIGRLAEDVEIRRYEPVVVAETRVDGDLDSATTEGFRRLAGYIFGGNRARERLSMTTPVAQQREPERIAMTAPVASVAKDGARVVAFYMPSGRRLETLPVPNDDRVVLRELPAREVAVLRYSGRVDQARFDRLAARLRNTLERAGRTPASPPESMRYDPPWTLPVLRRNEVWIELGPEPARA